jgi:hypothetical protein
MKYTEEQIREAIDNVLGDGGFRSQEIIETLRIIAGFEKPKLRHWVDENGNFRVEVIK